MQKRLKSKQAFTLLEMLVVLFIVAILMLLVVPNIGAKRERIDKQGTQALASVIQTQVELYELENKNQSVSLDALVEGGYLSHKQAEEALERHISISGDGHVSYPE
ncbi:MULTISPECIES: competence type IV pilus major pilin ComGC [unclassified Granulicatella]|uniref:competence type IV pilus major pilin ComGC n=1 Tax=unclassified Granulicatella TaxID=2630493 RepID=UPI0010743E94|nr:MULTISPECIES: competence type IV pilus major pilin ComGC [unclassified Granulicatella]MBF0780553.1 prepilin-type N-terminal cleavage/methylation domain-containing protein [Granulicatella sp. 19428wC4_WM01]TFU94907.1 prepilin-type N-terminal cleavage/methylation domain-containing protein [Granulicatella sp. WM01]